MTAATNEKSAAKASTTPFGAWLQRREGAVWTSADTVTVLDHLRQVERLALAVVERIR